MNELEEAVSRALEPYMLELEIRLRNIEKIQPNGNTIKPIDTREFKENLRE